MGRERARFKKSSVIFSPLHPNQKHRSPLKATLPMNGQIYPAMRHVPSTWQVLLQAPVGTGLGLVMGITVMGANDFMDFLLSYFVDLGLIMLFRVNIDPALGDILEAIGGM